MIRKIRLVVITFGYRSALPESGAPSQLEEVPETRGISGRRCADSFGRQFRPDVRQHVVGHARKVPFGFPAPLLTGAGVVQRIGPAGRRFLISAQMISGVKLIEAMLKLLR